MELEISVKLINSSNFEECPQKTFSNLNITAYVTDDSVYRDVVKSILNTIEVIDITDKPDM